LDPLEALIPVDGKYEKPSAYVAATSANTPSYVYGLYVKVRYLRILCGGRWAGVDLRGLEELDESSAQPIT
jgi:hypothetical protein